MPESYELTMWLRKAYLAFHRHVNAWMLRYELTADQYVLLCIVARAPGITQNKIGERTASDPNTVAAIVKLLERRGLIRRERHAEDGRARCVFLTSVGRNLERRASEASESLRAAMNGCTSARDHSQNLQFLQRVHHVFSAPLAGANGQPARPQSANKKTQ